MSEAFGFYNNKYLLNMKKFLKYAIMGAFALCVSSAAWGCSDNDDKYKDEVIAASQLPKTVRDFVSSYFPGDEIVRVVKDVDKDGLSYEVRMKSGAEMEFDEMGNWEDVSVPYGVSVPSGIIPENIRTYLDGNYAGTAVHEISRDARGYEVEFATGLELHFDPAGVFIYADK